MMRHRTAFGVIVSRLVPPLALLAASWVALAAAPARAYEEQASVEVAAGAGILPAATLPPWLASLDVGAAMGLSDMFVLRGAVGYAGLFESGVQVQGGRARAELAYLIDVLRWVPYFGVGFSLWLHDHDGVQVRPAGHALFGLDFLYDRSWTVGIDLRTGLMWEPEGLSSMSEAQLRLSRMFDLF